MKNKISTWLFLCMGAVFFNGCTSISLDNYPKDASSQDQRSVSNNTNSKASAPTDDNGSATTTEGVETMSVPARTGGSSGDMEKGSNQPAAVAPAPQKSASNVYQPTTPAVAKEDSTPAVIQTVEFKLGVSSNTVEKLGKQEGCISTKGAALITTIGPKEVYRMTCQDGEIFMATCELRQCTPMATGPK